MRVYRVHNYDDAEGSFGFKFVASKKEAERLKREFGSDWEVEAIRFQPTKAGILALLNVWASHPDNG